MTKTSTPSLLLSVLLLLAPCAAAFAQGPNRGRPGQPPPARPMETQLPPQLPRATPTPRDANEDDVLRITTNLVQVDAVVVDKDGRQVTNLTAEDFEIFEAGKPQKITGFSYVSAQPPAASPAASPAEVRAANPTAAPSGKGAMPPPPLAPTRQGRALRTMALVVDDLCMAHGSVGPVKGSLKKFVDEQMQPGDVAAIFRTRSGNSVLQQFTSDRNQLHRAINNLRWLPPPPGQCGNEFDPARADYTVKINRDGAVSPGASTFEDERSRLSRERIEDLGRDRAVAGTFGVLGLTLRGMREAPGRKSLVLFSDGMPLFTRNRESLRAFDMMRRVVDAANRAGVVIYTVDTRGVTIPGFVGAQDEVLPEETLRISRERVEAERASLDGFGVADATGGFVIRNMNDFNRALRRVLNDQSGYYLIGYRPSEESLKKGRDTFRDIDVKVKREGLRVRARSGFFAPAVEERPSPRRGTDSELYALLVAPVDKGEVEMRLTASFNDRPGAGPVVRTMLHVDGRGLSFKDESNGWKRLVLDVAAATIGENGKVADEFTRTHTVRLDPEAARIVSQNGIVYTADVPIKKPGAYQFRIVVRDQASQRIGSASQFIEAPDLKKEQLALSGITLRDAAAAAAAAAAGARATAETALAAVTAPSDPAVRRFRPGTILAYDFWIYSPAARAAGQPRLTTETRLFREGQLVLASPEEPFDAAGQTDPARLSESRLFKLNEQAAPGEYALQITVNEIDPKGKRRTTTQWVDFEVVK